MYPLGYHDGTLARLREDVGFHRSNLIARSRARSLRDADELRPIPNVAQARAQTLGPQFKVWYTMTIGRLSLGTAQLGMPYGVSDGTRTLTEGEVTSVLQAAVDLGISAIDTAPVYGFAEQRVGAFLDEHNLLDEISICTKLPALGKIVVERLDHHVEERVTGSLNRLCCDCIDCYLIHDVNDLRAHGEALIEALVHQRERGRVLEFGVSVNDPADLALLTDYPELSIVQHPFNLLDRRLRIDDWPARLRTAGTKLQIRSVLLQGLLTLEPQSIPASMGEARDAVAVLREALAELGLSLPEAAVAFALEIDADRVIVAAESATQLEQLAAATTASLPDALARILAERLDGLPHSVIDPRAWPTVAF